jgi:hypothetical protein
MKKHIYRYGIIANLDGAQTLLHQVEATSPKKALDLAMRFTGLPDRSPIIATDITESPIAYHNRKYVVQRIA